MLGEGYTPDDEEDSAMAAVSNVYVYQVCSLVCVCVPVVFVGVCVCARVCARVCVYQVRSLLCVCVCVNVYRMCSLVFLHVYQVCSSVCLCLAVCIFARVCVLACVEGPRTQQLETHVEELVEERKVHEPNTQTHTYTQTHTHKCIHTHAHTCTHTLHTYMHDDLPLQARYRVPIARATAGNIVLVEGIDATITKTATVVSDALDSEMHIFK